MSTSESMIVLCNYVSSIVIYVLKKKALGGKKGGITLL